MGLLIMGQNNSKIGTSAVIILQLALTLPVKTLASDLLYRTFNERPVYDVFAGCSLTGQRSIVHSLGKNKLCNFAIKVKSGR